MCFHPDRCDILSVTQSKRKHYHALHGQMLKSVNSTHFLGVTLTSDTTWETHQHHQQSKQGRTLKIGSSLVKGRAYKAVVTPVLEYASSIWHPNNINLINRLESVQQKAAWWTPQRCCRISSVNNMLTTLG